MRRLAWVILVWLVFAEGKSQNSQVSPSYGLLGIGKSPKAAGLGGYLTAAQDTSVISATDQPAFISPTIAGYAGMTYVNYLADLNQARLSAAFKVGENHVLVPFLHYMSYGKFVRTDIYGAENGEFTASDLVFGCAAGHRINGSLSIGGAAKLLYSDLSFVKSAAAAIDLSAGYVSPGRMFTAGVEVMNLGYRFITYSEGDNRQLPAVVNFGIAQRIMHAPFRIHLNYANAQKWNLTYALPGDTVGKLDPVSGDIVDPVFTFEKLAKHLSAGVEVLAGRSLTISLGYNHLRRSEMRIPERGGLAGFSCGVGLNTKKFQFGYTLAAYHFKGYTNSIYFAMDLSRLLKSGREVSK